MAVAWFRFHGGLNTFVAPQRRERAFACRFAQAATVKHAIEALGVPHTEVGAIVANDRPVDFGHRMHEGDRIEVHPEAATKTHPEAATEVLVPSVRLRPSRPQPARFVADAHLGGLARLLRMAGFDTLYDNSFADEDICRRSVDDGRVVLTQDRELLKSRSVVHGCYVHAREVDAQFREVVSRLRAQAEVRSFTRCLCCNLPLAPIDKAAVADRLPGRVALDHERFRTCPGCRRVYWEGSHWARMRAMLQRLLSEGDSEGSPR